MSFDAAHTKERGVLFTVVAVQETATQPANQEATRRNFQRRFPEAPVVLMSQDWQGVPTYFGRPDLVEFLVGVHPAGLPWRTYQR